MFKHKENHNENLPKYIMCDNSIHSLRSKWNVINLPLCLQFHELSKSNNFKINPKYSGGLCSHSHLCFFSCQFFTLYSSLWLFLYLCPGIVTAYSPWWSHKTRILFVVLFLLKCRGLKRGPHQIPHGEQL